MKEISELKLPENVKYTEDHEWVRPADGKARIGISDYAQDQLGDIVYVELPDIGSTFKKGEALGLSNLLRLFQICTCRLEERFFQQTPLWKNHLNGSTASHMMKAG